MAENEINVYEENGFQVIDLTQVSLPHFFSDYKGAIIDEGYGPELPLNKVGNDLVIEYNGTFNETYDEYLNSEKYVIKNYFKSGNKSNIKVKVNYCDYSTGNIIEEGKIFDLNEVLKVMISYEDLDKGRKITGTNFNDDIDGTQGNDTIYGNGGNDVIYGLGGNDVIYGGDGDDHIWGDEGNNKLYGGKGNNSFYFNSASANDTIYSNGGEDTIVFEHLTNTDEINFDVKGNDLIIEYSTNKHITINNYLKNPNSHSVKYVKLYDEYSNPQIVPLFDLIASKPGILDGSDGNDTLRGSALADIITGNKGDDKLYGGKGKNTFVFYDGDGNDTIYYEGGEDIIDLRNVENLNVSSSSENAQYKTEAEKQGNDLIIKYTSNFDETTEEEKYDKIRLSNYFKNGEKSDIKVILRNDEAGNPIYTDLKDFVAVDIAFDDAEKGKNITGTFLNDYIDGTDFNDTIHGGKGNDDIYGGLGNDKLYGDYGNNVFEFDVSEFWEDDVTFKGDGKDTIYSGKGNDSIRLVTYLPTGNFDGWGTPETRPLTVDDIKLSAKGNSLVLHYNDEDSIELADYFKVKDGHSVKEIELYTKDGLDTQKYTIDELLDINRNKIEGIEDKKNTLNGSALNDIITGGKLSDTIKGGLGNDIIYGNAGDDKLYGEDGNNKLVFKTYDGNDTVYMGKGSDSLLFAENALDSLKYEKSGNHLIVKYGEGDSVTINNYFSSKYKSVDTISEISDYDDTKLIISHISLEKDIIIGKNKSTLFADCYVGNDYNNLIVANNNKKLNYVEAGAGDDVIYCQAKQVIAKGESGDDTYVVSSLKNSTGIYDTDGEDIIQIADKSSNVNLIFNVTRCGDLDEYTGMYILNKSTLSGLIKSRNFDNVTSGVEIDSFFDNNGSFGNSSIFRIETSNGYVGTEEINAVRENVVSWLSDNGYDSALDALNNADKSSVNELVAIYQNIDWQPQA